MLHADETGNGIACTRLLLKITHELYNKAMTLKQKAFVKEYIDTKGNATEAALRVYNTNRDVARRIGAENLTKPVIQSQLAGYTELLESAIIGTVKDWKKEDNSRKREIAMQNAQWAHDKIHGKAKQSIETTNTSVEVKVDLSGVRIGAHYQAINQPKTE